MPGCLLFFIFIYSFHMSQTQALLPPKLKVNPTVITETETVTLDCQIPSSDPVHQCYFYTVRTRSTKGNTCLLTLTGTDLLRMSQQSSPAVVQLNCFYTKLYGDISSPSHHSDTSSIIIQSIGEKESRVTQTKLTPTTTTGVTAVPRTSPVTPVTSGVSVRTSGTKNGSNPATRLEPASGGTRIWKILSVVSGCGLIVGIIIFLISAILCNKIRSGSEEVKRWRKSHNDNCYTYLLYATVSEEPAASFLMTYSHTETQTVLFCVEEDKADSLKNCQ